MLPAPHRLRSARGFSDALRTGQRAGTRRLGVSAAPADPANAVAGEASTGPAAQVGFVVSRAVGRAVVRNRVKRRLRSVVRERLDRLRPAHVYVVRAHPESASASYQDLQADLDRCLDKLERTG